MTLLLGSVTASPKGTVHTCLACGLKDFDVRMTLVEVPEAERRIVEVTVVVAADAHGRPTGLEQRHVRELYASEPRCRDRMACRERARIAWAEFEASRTPAAPAAEAPVDEELAWLG